MADDKRVGGSGSNTGKDFDEQGRNRDSRGQGQDRMGSPGMERNTGMGGTSGSSGRSATSQGGRDNMGSTPGNRSGNTSGSTSGSPSGGFDRTDRDRGSRRMEDEDTSE